MALLLPHERPHRRGPRRRARADGRARPTIGIVGSVKQSVIHRYRFPPRSTRSRWAATSGDPATGGSPGTVVAIDDGGGHDRPQAGPRQARSPTRRSLVPYDHVETDASCRRACCASASGSAEHGDRRGRRLPLPRGICSFADLRAPDRRPARRSSRLTGEAVSRPRFASATTLDDELPADPGPARLGQDVHRRPDDPGPGRGREEGRRHREQPQGHRQPPRRGRSRRRRRRASRSGSASGPTSAGDRTCRAAVPFESNGAALDALAGRRGRRRRRHGLALVARGDRRLGRRPRRGRGRPDVARQHGGGLAGRAGASSCSATRSSSTSRSRAPTRPGAERSALAHLLGRRSRPCRRSGACSSTAPGASTRTSARTRRRCSTRASSTLRPGNERQALAGDRAARRHRDRASSPCEHDGQRHRLARGGERDRGARRRAARRRSARWTDRDGATTPLTLDDVLVVAAVQRPGRARSRDRLPGARVGTVDKFQGQEAPVSIYSMASSPPRTRRAAWSSSTASTGSTSPRRARGASPCSSRARSSSVSAAGRRARCASRTRSAACWRRRVLETASPARQRRNATPGGGPVRESRTPTTPTSSATSVAELIARRLDEHDPWRLALVQRHLVWDEVRMAHLLDSLLAGYPIGSLLVCRVRQEAHVLRETGRHARRREGPGRDLAAPRRPAARERPDRPVHRPRPLRALLPRHDPPAGSRGGRHTPAGRAPSPRLHRVALGRRRRDGAAREPGALHRARAPPGVGGAAERSRRSSIRPARSRPTRRAAIAILNDIDPGVRGRAGRHASSGPRRTAPRGSCGPGQSRRSRSSTSPWTARPTSSRSSRASTSLACGSTARTSSSPRSRPSGRMPRSTSTGSPSASPLLNRMTALRLLARLASRARSREDLLPLRVDRLNGPEGPLARRR